MTPGAGWAATRRLRWLVDDPRAARWLVAAALLFGLQARLRRAEDAPFGVDLGESYEIARDLATGRHLPVLGASASWGGRTPFPGYFYAIAPPLLVSDSPLLFARWGALLCGLGLLPFALLLWERYGPRAAVFGAWLASTSPWLLVNGDSPWSPKVGMAAASLLFYAVHRVIARPRSRWGAILPLAVVLQLHLYPSLPPTLAATVAALVVGRPRLHLGWLLVGTALATATVVPSLIALASGAEGTGHWTPHPFPLRMAREILEACYHTLAFGTAEMAYELFHASWKTFRLDAFLGGLPGALPRWYGGVPGGVWVAITFAAATAAWIRSGARGLRALVHGGPRALDPMGAALAAGLAGTIALLLVAHRPYAPRYDLALAWLSLVPLVQVAAARGRWSAVLLAALLVAVPANAAIAARYYRRFVPPYAARTLVEVVDTIVARRRGEPFSLFYAAGDGIALTADRVARPRHGAAWRRTRTADVLYRPVAHGTWRGPKVRLLPVYRADLVEAPGRRSR